MEWSIVLSLPSIEDLSITAYRDQYNHLLQKHDAEHQIRKKKTEKYYKIFDGCYSHRTPAMHNIISLILWGYIPIKRNLWQPTYLYNWPVQSTCQVLGLCASTSTVLTHTFIAVDHIPLEFKLLFGSLNDPPWSKTTCSSRSTAKCYYWLLCKYIIILIYTCTYPLVGSTVIPLLLLIPVTIVLVPPLMASNILILPRHSSDQYSFSVTQSQAMPSVSVAK